MKRRQRAGLPIYPQEFQEETIPFHIKNQIQHQHQEQNHPNVTNPSSSSFSSLFPSPRKASYNPSLTLLDPINFSPALDPLNNNLTRSFYSNPAVQFKSFPDNNASNCGLALPLSSYGRSPSSITGFNQNFPAQSIPMTPPSLHYSTSDFETNMSFTSLIMGAQVEPNELFPCLGSEIPSDQTPPRPNTPFSSNTSGGVCVREESSKNTDNDSETVVPEMMHDNRNSGLLDALLLESQNLSRKEGKLTGENSLVATDQKGKRVVDESAEEEEETEKEAAKRVKLSAMNGSENSGENNCCDDLSSSQSSIGKFGVFYYF